MPNTSNKPEGTRTTLNGVTYETVDGMWKVSEDTNNPLGENAAPTEDRTKVFTGTEAHEQGGYYSLPSSVNRMETPIAEGEVGNPVIESVVNSEQYQQATDSSTRNKLLNDAVKAANDQIYQDSGDEGFGGIRYQQGITKDGDKKTYFVPPTPKQPIDPRKTFNASPAIGIAATALQNPTFQRVVGGGLAEAAKGVGNVVEKGLEYIGIGDPEEEYFKENFPTMAPASPLEETGQVVISTVATSIGGAGLAAKVDKVLKASPKIAKWITARYDEAKKINPKFAAKEVEKWVRALIIERGMNLGATAGTPEDADPLVGDYLLDTDTAKALGFSSEENKYLAHYLDNEAFSFGIATLVRMGRGVKYLKDKSKIGNAATTVNKKETAVGMNILSELDPGITPDLPGTILADRARILGEVVAKNKQFEFALLGGNVDADLSMALAQGAEEYMRRAYAFRKGIMPEEAFEKMIKTQTDEMVLTSIALKRSRLSSTPVAQSNAGVNTQVANLMGDTADAIATPSQSADAAQALGQQIVDTVSSSADNVAASRQAMQTAEDSVVVKGKNEITDLLVKARNESALGADQTERALFESLTGEQLYTGFKRSYDNYTNLFKEIPDGIPVDWENFTALLDDVAAQTHSFDTITTNATKADPLRKMLEEIRPRMVEDIAEDGSEIMRRELPEEIWGRLGDVDLKTLYTEIRPALSRRIGYLQEQKLGGSEPLIALKQAIDDMTEQTGDPAFQTAMDAYKKHEGTYAANKVLSQYSNQAKQVVDEVPTASGRVKGLTDTYEAGMAALNASQAGNTPLLLDDLVIALSDAAKRDVKPEMAQAYLGMALRALTQMTKEGASVGSEQILKSVQPFIRSLSTTNEAVVAKFDDAVRGLQQAESGLGSATDDLARAEKAHAEILQEARSDAASRFVYQVTGNPKVLEDFSVQFAQLFDSAEAPDIILDLYKRAAEAGDPLVKEGIQGQFLRHLLNKVQTSGRIGLSGGKVVNEVSAAKLSSIVDGKASNVLTTLRTVFDDKPEMAGAIQELLQVQSMAVNGRALKGVQYGSDTVYNDMLKKTADRMIMISVGVLNPMATKLRNLNAAMFEGRNAEVHKSIEVILDMALIDPNKFEAIMSMIAKNNEKGVPEFLGMLHDYMGRGAMAANKRKEEFEVPTLMEDQTIDAFAQ